MNSETWCASRDVIGRMRRHVGSILCAPEGPPNVGPSVKDHSPKDDADVDAVLPSQFFGL